MADLTTRSSHGIGVLGIILIGQPGKATRSQERYTYYESDAPGAGGSSVTPHLVSSAQATFTDLDARYCFVGRHYLSVMLIA